jgi:helix-turn-helix protein
MDTTVKYIESLCVELEQSYTIPNTLCIQKQVYEGLKREFPYMVNNKKYRRPRGDLEIIFTEDDVILVGYSFLYVEPNRQVSA